MSSKRELVSGRALVAAYHGERLRDLVKHVAEAIDLSEAASTTSSSSPPPRSCLSISAHRRRAVECWLAGGGGIAHRSGAARHGHQGLTWWTGASCCGQQRGPSEDHLARAHVAILAREAAPDIADLCDDDLAELWEELLDLPALDISLLVELPKLVTPDLQRLRQAIADDDPDRGWDARTAVATQVDTPRQRAQLAHALVALRNQQRIDREQAAAAIVDLDSRSTRFIAASLLEAVALSAGVSRTPGGLEIADDIAA